jgi:uncharacterized protein (TIGR02597 family)
MNRLGKFLATLGLLLAWPLAGLAQSSVTTDPVGFVTLTVRGHGGAAASALSFIGLSMTRPVEFQGVIDQVSSSTIVCNNATWADNAFNAGSGPCFLEITSGPWAGLMVDIVNTVAATKSLELISPIPVVGGETFKVRKHWTLAAIFGATNSAGLGGGGSAAEADEILIYDAVNKRYDVYFYKNAGLGGTGWRSTASSASASAVPLYIDEGILVRRKQATDVAVVLSGAVKTGPTIVPITGNGLNIVANVYPGGALTLGASQLYTSSTSTGLAGGTIATADLVQVYNGSSYVSYYYKNSGLGGTGWRADTGTADVSATVISSGASVIIYRKLGGSFYWVMPQPF